MAKTRQTLLICLLTFLLIASIASARSQDPSAILSDLFDDGSEMNARIISEFLSSPGCRNMCRNWSEGQIAKEFQGFRSKWVEKMINFVIEQLNVDPESAKRVRQNPNNYMTQIIHKAEDQLKESFKNLYESKYN